MNIVWLNGNMLPKEQASIPIDDRSFRFGDGVFETIRVHNGKPYLLEQHIKRLKKSLKEVFISYETSMIENVIPELIQRNEMQQGYIRITISRGSGSLGYAPIENIEPLSLIECIPPRPQTTAPLRLAISTYEKVSHAALPITSKINQGLSSTLCKIEAQEKGVDDVILLDKNLFITETSSHNLFIIKDKSIYTPKRHAILNGIIRQRIFALSPQQPIESDLPIDALKDADEIFVSNISGIRPVGYLAECDKTWDTFPITEQLQALIKDDMDAHC